MRADWIHNLTSDNNSATKGKNQDDEKGNGVEHERVELKVDLTQAGEQRRSWVPARFPAFGSQPWSIGGGWRYRIYVKEWGAQQSE